MLRRIHSNYHDETPVCEGHQPARIAGLEPAAQGLPHSVIRWDGVNRRVYLLRESGLGGKPVPDIDSTNPTYPDDRMRPGHPGPPHQHRWLAVDPANPAAGFRRGGPEGLP